MHTQAGLLSAVSSAFMVAVQPAAIGDGADTADFAIGFYFSSLLVSLLAALIAMMLKQLLNWYALTVCGSMIERCRSRQDKYDRLQGVSFGLCYLALPRMFDVSSIMLISGSVLTAGGDRFRLIVTLLWFTAYFALTRYVATASSTWTPTSITLRPSRKETWLTRLGSLWNNIRRVAFRLVPRPSQGLPMLTIQSGPSKSTITPPWLTPAALATLRGIHSTHVKCVSWILWNITNSVALDAAIRIAGVAPWFEDGLNVDPPYHMIIATLRACFDFEGKVHPGLRDRLFYSARAVLWIYIRATCEPRPPLPSIPHVVSPLDPDLEHLLGIFARQDAQDLLARMYHIAPGLTPRYTQWVSNALLHLSWAGRGGPEDFDSVDKHHAGGDWSDVPLKAVLNRLLTWCVFLDWPVDKLALRVQDKTCVICCFRPPSSCLRCRYQ